MDDDEIDLSLYLPDDPPAPPPEKPGEVDVTTRVRDGQVRVATTQSTAVLTVAGADGMVTVRLGEGDIGIVTSLLSSAADDLRRRRRGQPW